MIYSKEQYEQQINNANIFTIDRVKDSERWKSEARRLSVIVCEYYKYCVLKEETFAEYACELFESIKSCIQSFKPDKGVFLHYVNVAFKNKVRQRKLKDALDKQRRGINVSDADNKMIRKVLQYVESKGYDRHDEKVQVFVAKTLHIPVEEIHLFISQSEISVIEETIVNQKGEQESIFDNLPSSCRTAEQVALEDEKQMDVLRRVDVVFQSCQNRQKPLLSRCLTAKLIPKMDLNDYVVSQLETVSFVDIELVKDFISSGEMPTARQISIEFGVAEQSVSRTLKVFFDKMAD